MKTNGHSKSNASLAAKVYATPRYRGKRVVIIHGNVFPSPPGRMGLRRLKSLLKKYPDDTPTIVYVPKADTFILGAWIGSICVCTTS